MNVQDIKNAIADYAVFSQMENTVEEFMDFFTEEYINQAHPHVAGLPKTPEEVFDVTLREGIIGDAMDMVCCLHDHKHSQIQALESTYKQTTHVCLRLIDQVMGLSKDELKATYLNNVVSTPLAFRAAAANHCTKKEKDFLDAYLNYCLSKGAAYYKHSSFYNFCVFYHLNGGDQL
jgi:hypothetical protein